MDKLDNIVFEPSVCQTLLDSTLDTFIVADENSKIVFWNAAAEIMFGYPRESAIGCKIHDLVVPVDVRDRAQNAFAHFKQTGAGPMINNVVEIEALHRNGHLFPVEISLSVTVIEDKYYSQAIVRSIGRRKEVEAEMKRLVTTDPLTGIYNRETMFAHGKREISRTMRYGHRLSVVLLDIDQLKQINEESGHYAGDQIIKALSAFLLDSCRQSDVIGRLSSKEFLLILPETEVSMAYMVAEKWRTTIEELNVTVDGVNIDFSCSIGVSGLGNEDRFEVLLKKVEANLQQAKISGGNQVVSNDQY